MSDGTDDHNDQLEKLKADIEVLANKNRELLGELRTAKAKAKGSEIDPAEHANLQNTVAELQEKLDKATKNAAKEIETLTKSLTEKDGALQSYLIDNGLSEAMLKVGVRPEFMGAAKAMLKSATTIKADNGQYHALMGDKPLADAVAEWAASDEGKHFVAAPANSGGGAPGSSNGGSRTPKGNLGGDRVQRVDALRARFPELNNT